MAIDEHDPEGRADDSDDSSPDEDGRAAAIEVRLEELADEMAAVIEAGPRADREALHDYAVSLVRERLPVAHDDERYQRDRSAERVESEQQGGLTKVAFGYGVLVLPVGLLVMLLFPPVGVTLVLMGGGMIAVGIVSGLVAKLIPRSRRGGE